MTEPKNDPTSGIRFDAHRPVTIPMYLAIEARNCLDSVARQYREMPKPAYQSVARQFQGYADEMQSVIDAAAAPDQKETN